MCNTEQNCYLGYDLRPKCDPIRDRSDPIDPIDGLPGFPDREELLPAMDDGTSSCAVAGLEEIPVYRGNGVHYIVKRKESENLSYNCRGATMEMTMTMTIETTAEMIATFSVSMMMG